MPRTDDLITVRSFLRQDPAWCAYALCDLTPEFLPRAEWYIPGSNIDTVVLLYRGFGMPVLFCAGAASRVPEILSELNAAGEVYLHVKPEVVSAIGAHRCSLKPIPREPAPAVGPGCPAAVGGGHERSVPPL